jgi:hypothetical protein
MQDPIKTLIRDGAPNEKQRIGSAGIVLLCRVIQSVCRRLIEPSADRLAKHHAGGNTEKEGQISARLDDNKAGSSALIF